MSIIKLNSIHKYYNKGKDSEVHALKNVSLEIEQGEMVALMGVSGSGKSTLLHILSFMDSFDSGEFFFEEENVEKKSNQLAERRNKDIGFVMQNYGLILHQTVLENVSLPLLLNNDIRFKSIKEKALGILKELGIEEKSNVSVDMLSGGQQQRVAIARAIANDPKVLIADEPTGALDTKTANEVMDIFKKLNEEKNMTVIIATHDKRVADACGRIITVQDGEVR